MCVSLKRHDALPFLPVGNRAMGTMFHIPGWLAQSPAGGLSLSETTSQLVRRALGVTCPTPPMRAYMVRGLTSGPPRHLPTAPHPLGLWARPDAVCTLYVEHYTLWGPHTHNPRVAMRLAWFSSKSSISGCACPRYQERSWEGGDKEPGSPRPTNHVLSTDSRRHLVNALIVNLPAFAAIHYYHFTTGSRCRSRTRRRRLCHGSDKQNS